MSYYAVHECMYLMLLSCDAFTY